MDTTESPFSVVFDGRTVVEVGGLLLESLPAHSFPVQFGTSATAIINSAYQRLDAFGNLAMTFSISTVRECSSHMDAWRAFYRWLDEWKNAGKGEWIWGDDCGHEQRFEAVISDAAPQVSGLNFIVEYNFTLGKPL